MVFTAPYTELELLGCVVVVKYKPLLLNDFKTGWMQQTVEYAIPNDAFTTMRNMYAWRGKLLKKKGVQFFDRLKRLFESESISNSSASPWSFNIFTETSVTETYPELQVGSLEIVVGAVTFTDDGDGTLSSVTPGNSGTVNYNTGDITLTHTAGAGAATTVSFGYYPNLPVMGLRERERPTLNFEETIAFDTTYAYRRTSSSLGWVEWIPGTTWTGGNADLFWTTNYWQTASDSRVFWATNSNIDDPIRWTDGTSSPSPLAWYDFEPSFDGGTEFVFQCEVLLPYRGRFVMFNTMEGTARNVATRKYNRIRWCWDGTPFYQADGGINTGNFEADAWNDGIPGYGGFLDIPTSDAIVTANYVRDNIVIFCESSTWVLRFTGSGIDPFQVDRVNDLLGAESKFSAISYDTSLLGIGDKGIIACDTYQSNRIDIERIPNFVFEISNANDNRTRPYGIRDFQQRLSYWTLPYATDSSDIIFPNARLVYNPENGSFALFDDQFTCFGTTTDVESPTWGSTTTTWGDTEITWGGIVSEELTYIAGNQQGFVGLIDQLSTNEPMFTIYSLSKGGSDELIVTAPNHNLPTGQVIRIETLANDGYESLLNGKRFGIIRTGTNTFTLNAYNASTQAFTDVVLDPEPAEGYLGGGTYATKDRVQCITKKYGYVDQGQNIRVGFIDFLANVEAEGRLSVAMHTDYNANTPTNIPANNTSFFNFEISQANTSNNTTEKRWHRFVCPLFANFVFMEYTNTDSQMNDGSAELELSLDGIIINARPAGKLLPN